MVISSMGRAYVTSLTIHSCATVFVANDSFAGVVITERLSFIGINRLTFEPYAFRKILQSPKQLVIDKCTLPVVLPNAFTGLSHMEHIWFRNSTIEKLSSHAFCHLTSVNYLYFRDVIFKHIEQRAFGKMYSIAHLFMGGIVRVDNCESHLFASSSIEEMIIEGLTGLLDVAFLLEADIRVISIRDSSLEYEIRDSDQGGISLRRIKSTSRRQNSVAFRNVSTNLLVPDLLTHFGEVIFANSSIRDVRPNQRSKVKYLCNDQILMFTNTSIGTVHSYAFSNCSAHILSIANCKIEKISRFAVAGAFFNHIEVTDTKVKDLDDHLLADSRVIRLEIVGTRVEHILPLAFQRSSVEEMLIKTSQINILDKYAFKCSQIHTLRISKTTVNNVKHRPFEDSQIRNLHISNCGFYGSTARQFLSALTPIRLTVVNSTFDCDAGDCEVNAMLLKTSHHDLLWSFQNNKCQTQVLDDSRSPPMCVQPSVFLQSGLSCRLSWAFAECVCTEMTAGLPRINVSVMIVGDCEHLNVADSEGLPAALYLFRITKVDLWTVPITVKTIKIYHSNAVVHPGAMENNRFISLSLSYANIYKVARKALNNVTIEELTVNNSFLSNWHTESVTTTSIKHAVFIDSRIGAVMSLLRTVAHLRIQNSVIFNGDGLSSMKSVYLNNNTVLCCCEHKGSDCENNVNMHRMCASYFGSFTCNSGRWGGSLSFNIVFSSYVISYLTINMDI